MARFSILVLLLPFFSCGEGSSVAGDSAVTDAPMTLVSEATRGPVSGQIRMGSGPHRFGDRVELQVHVQATEQARVATSEVPFRLGHLRVRDHRILEQSDREWTLRLRVEAERTGKNVAKFPPVRFHVLSGEGAGQEWVLDLPSFVLQAEPVPFGELPDLSAIARSPLPLNVLPGRSESSWLVFAAPAFLVALLLSAYLWSRRRGEIAPEVVQIDPREEARRALVGLLKGDLIKRGAVGAFYVGLTGIVRRFVERTTGVDAPDQTTEEFLGSIAQHPAFPAQKRAAFEGFLGSADLVKYAAQIPTDQEVFRSVDLAREFCELSEADVPYAEPRP